MNILSRSVRCSKSVHIAAIKAILTRAGSVQPSIRKYARKNDFDELADSLATYVAEQCTAEHDEFRSVADMTFPP